jgi:hypothetical protein
MKVEFEIWASDSGNRLYATVVLDDALAWAFDYWLHEGDAALNALSVGDASDQWVLSGRQLREVLRRRRVWDVPATLETSASSELEDWSHGLGSPAAPAAAS